MNYVVIVVVLVLLVVAYLYMQHLGPFSYLDSPEYVCGPGYDTKAGSSVTPDCMRSMWLNTGCNKNGDVWTHQLDPTLSSSVYNTTNAWWLQRPTIGDIEKDMKSYYSLGKNGSASHVKSCGL